MKLGCILTPETKAKHAVMAMAPAVLLPAWTRIIGTPRILGGNNSIGDCVIVSGFNALQTYLARKGIFAPLPEDLPPEIYSEITGYVPGDPSTDKGTNPEDFLAWWQANAICGYKLKNFQRLNPADLNGIRNAIVNTGGVSICSALSLQQEGQQIWKPVGTPGTWGGHMTFVDSYEADLFYETSWGDEYQIEDDYFQAKGFVEAAFSFELTSA